MNDEARHYAEAHGRLGVVTWRALEGRYCMRGVIAIRDGVAIVVSGKSTLYAPLECVIGIDYSADVQTRVTKQELEDLDVPLRKRLSAVERVAYGLLALKKSLGPSLDIAATEAAISVKDESARTTLEQAEEVLALGWRYEDDSWRFVPSAYGSSCTKTILELALTKIAIRAKYPETSGEGSAPQG